MNIVILNSEKTDYFGDTILELTNDNTVMLCTKVVMNPEKRIQISEPKKGEFVSRTEFENIVEVKTKEMRDMWRGGRSKSIRKN